MPHDVSIFTDGSSRGNPGPGGWGAIIVLPMQDNENNEVGSKNYAVKEIGGREDHTTNNRMELTAAIEALSVIHNSKFVIHVYTDSTYLIKGITEWIFGWQKNDWKTKAKQDVENRDLWEELFTLTAGKKIEWHKVEGHSGHDANERCDEIATQFADNINPKLYKGPLSNYKISLEAKPRGKKEILYVSLVGGIAYTDKTWDECEARVRGKAGARFKKVKSREEAESVLANWQSK